MNPPSDFLLIERINQCPKLASLESINETLANLLDSEDSFVGQIAEVIRLDPSLTTRVLDLVNSIFFGSKEDHHITGVEEASIFLGLNRIRELIAATPIIEEISALGKKSEHFSWESFWRHSIGTAILTREILSIADHKVEQEADYVAGLLHNLGILILAITFPEIFPHVYGKSHQSLKELTTKEVSLVGWDHAKMGAYYLWNHHISEEVVEAVHWHEELGIAQAMWVIRANRMGPFIVASDLAGNCLFERENAKIAANLEKVYQGTKPAELRRLGETDDRSDEMIG